MAIRLVIDFEEAGAVEDALAELTRDHAGVLKRFSKSLENVYLEEYLPGKDDRIKVTGVSLHTHGSPDGCNSCTQLSVHTTAKLARYDVPGAYSVE